MPVIATSFLFQLLFEKDYLHVLSISIPVDGLFFWKDFSLHQAEELFASKRDLLGTFRPSQAAWDL